MLKIISYNVSIDHNMIYRKPYLWVIGKTHIIICVLPITDKYRISIILYALTICTIQCCIAIFHMQNVLLHCKVLKYI